MLSLNTLEHWLGRQGRFCLLDWLMAENLLPYGDYEGWRYGQRDTLTGAIGLDDDALAALLEATHEAACALGLQASEQIYYGWGEQFGRHLQLAAEQTMNRDLGQHWQRPQDVLQPDLFMDGGAAICENLLIDALAGRDWTAAEKQLQQLSKLNSAHPQLGGYQDLLNYGHHIQASTPIAAEGLNDEWRGLEKEVSGLARELMGPRVRDYLAMAWRRLADNLTGRQFDPAHPHLHSGMALARIPDWEAALSALEADPLRFQHPALVAALLTCSTHLQQRERSLLLWCLFFETFEDEAATAIEQSDDPAATALWEQFWECGDWDSSLFPAYVLLRRAGLIHHLDAIPPLESATAQAVIDLLRQKCSGDSEVAARQKLQSVSPELLGIYLQRSSNKA